MKCLVKIGRPLKYQALLMKLDSNVIDSPTSVLDCALRFGHVCVNDPHAGKILHRIRSSCGYIAKRYGFPVQGDEMVFRKGQRPVPGWYGWRWKEAVREHRRQIIKEGNGNHQAISVLP